MFILNLGNQRKLSQYAFRTLIHVKDIINNEDLAVKVINNSGTK